MTGDHPHEEIRRLAQDREVVVFDLDGVLRSFRPETTDDLSAALGITRQEFLELAFAPGLLRPVVTGATTVATWGGQIKDALVEWGGTRETVEVAVDGWLTHRGEPVPETVELAAELQSAGRAVFVFTNGTDTVPAEMRQIGLGHLADAVLNSADFGVAKPDPAAYAAAHRAMEERLGRSLHPGAVVFTDDRADNIAAARDFGWQAVHFDTPARTDI